MFIGIMIRTIHILIDKKPSNGVVVLKVLNSSLFYEIQKYKKE